MTSKYEEKHEDFVSELNIKMHPEDRIADAGEDDENIETDWSKIYSSTNRIDSEISAATAYNRKRRLKKNKVSFKDSDDFNMSEDEYQNHNIKNGIIKSEENIHTVIAELNPEVLHLERKLDKSESFESEETEVLEYFSDDTVSYENIGNHEQLNEQFHNDDSDDGDIFTVENLKLKWLRGSTF